MFDFFKREMAADEPAATKSYAGGTVFSLTETGRPAWSGRDDVSLTRIGFLGNPVGFRAVKLIAEAAAALPLVLRDRRQRFSEHAVLQLVRRPNGMQGGQDFLESLFGQMLLTGNGYIEAASGELGLPFALHVLRSDLMSIVIGNDGWPRAYDYSTGGRKRRIELGTQVSPICHIRSFHPLNDHSGLSPMTPAASAIDVHNSASAWSKALLDNAARPSGAIVYHDPDGGGHLSDDQHARLSAELENQHQGARNAGRPMLLEGGLDWKPMGFSPSDMEFQKTKEAAAREIATAFGVPPMLLGIPGDATYANYQEANRAFYRLTVLPLAQRVARSLADWLGDFSGEDLELHPDLDQVSALAPEREAQWRRVSAASFLSDDEKRAALGLATRAGGAHG